MLGDRQITANFLRYRLIISLRLKVSNNFPVMSGRSHRFLVIASTFRGVNASLFKDSTAEVGIELSHSRSGVGGSPFYIRP